MSNRKYINKAGDELYAVHFPGDNTEVLDMFTEYEIDRKIKVNSNISMISIMNRECWNHSPIRKQCQFNDIPLYNLAMNQTQWNNTLKMNYIIKCLEWIDTEYAFISDGRDVILVNDLDDAFIEKYKAFGKPILYNATPNSFPIIVEDINYIVHVKGNHKFLNAGVCFGKKKELLEFYKTALELTKGSLDRNSEQEFIRQSFVRHQDIATYDSESKLFMNVHHGDSNFTITDDKVQILI